MCPPERRLKSPKTDSLKYHANSHMKNSQLLTRLIYNEELPSADLVTQINSKHSQKEDQESPCTC